MINNNLSQHIELPVFDEADVFEYVEKNKKSANTEILKEIMDFTDGLPVFVSLLLNNNLDVLSSITYDRFRMEEYLRRIVDDLPYRLCEIAQYIGFLSITIPIIPISVLSSLVEQLSLTELKKLESSALIEIHRDTQEIKMHELFRDYLCRRYYNAEPVIRKIYEYHHNLSHLYEEVYYQILICDAESEQAIQKAIQAAVNEENYAYLLMVGEHYKRIFDWSTGISRISEITFLSIIFGYLEGQIGVGNYPAAREVVDKCKITARYPKSDFQFKFSLTTAQLYHLQNNYDEAIASYEILLESVYSDAAMEKCEARCLWGIAHSLRHQGKDLDSALEYYRKSNEVASKLGREGEKIKSIREELTILLFQGKFEEAHILHKKLCMLVRKLPKDSYKGTRLAFLKTEVVYMISSRQSNYLLEHKLLSKVLDEYRKQRKRLQYNTYFLFGEHYRHQGLIPLAKENYEVSLVFSQKNKDHNLETMSQIALFICNILLGETEYPAVEADIIQCIETCRQFDLHTNRLLAEIILSYVQQANVDQATIRELIHLQYADAIRVCNNMDAFSLQNLNLFLM